tara:strand:+ start:530 stop:1717 length:1188 start_codon:yes stop_codon:yes gene_type:complete
MREAELADLKICNPENSGLVDLVPYNMYTVDAVKAADQKLLYFLEIPNLDEFQIEFSYTPPHQFQVFSWNSDTCPLKFYTCVPNPNPSNLRDQNAKPIECKKSVERSELFFNSAKYAMERKQVNPLDTDIKIPAETYEKALQHYDRSNPCGYMSELYNNTINHVIVKKDCHDKHKTPLRNTLFINEMLKKMGKKLDFSNSNSLIVNNKVDEEKLAEEISKLNKILKEKTPNQDTENVLMEEINKSLIGLTLLMRDVQKDTDMWHYANANDIKSSMITRLHLKAITEHNSPRKLKPGHFFWPTTPPQVKTFVEDVARCYLKLTEKPKSNILAICFVSHLPQVFIDSMHTDIFRLLYVKSSNMNTEPSPMEMSMYNQMASESDEEMGDGSESDTEEE